MKRTINKEWHLAHPMPRNPTLEQRLEWHLMHAANCNCRDMPAGIRKELDVHRLIERRRVASRSATPDVG